MLLHGCATVETVGGATCTGEDCEENSGRDREVGIFEPDVSSEGADEDVDSEDDADEEMGADPVDADPADVSSPLDGGNFNSSDAPVNIPFGGPCAADSECVSGVCVLSAGSCSELCSGACERGGYECRSVDGRSVCAVVAGGGGCGAASECRAGERDNETEACGSCGEGSRSRFRLCDVGTCSWGEWIDWGACLTEATCSLGQTEELTEACGTCSGIRRRGRSCMNSTCQWDDWSGWGACETTDECTPGETQTEEEGCGTCGGGTRSRTRRCDDSCGWGAWGSFGTCSGGGGACSPGERQTREQGCGNCGQQSSERVCGGDCTWGGWSSWGTCGGTGPCAPGAREDTVRCFERVCQATCQWGGDQLKLNGSGRECEWREGRNWQCCGPQSWQFCLPPGSDNVCMWSTACEVNPAACP
jgi:hypothetical protein